MYPKLLYAFVLQSLPINHVTIQGSSMHYRAIEDAQLGIAPTIRRGTVHVVYRLQRTGGTPLREV